MAIFPEENLLNNEDLVPAELLEEVEHGYAPGYSIATHEMAHCVDMNGLHSSHHRLLQKEYKKKIATNALFTDGWRDPKRREGRGCYASHTVFEYFAQLTNTWLGTNFGLDPHFSICVGHERCRSIPANEIAQCAAVDSCDSEHFPRANTAEWIIANERPEIVALMRKLYRAKRLVSFPVVLNAGKGFVYSPTHDRAGEYLFQKAYLSVDKQHKILFVYRHRRDAMRGQPSRAKYAVSLKGAGTTLWDQEQGPKQLWARRPDVQQDCVRITTIHKMLFYFCQENIEKLLMAVNEAIFLS